MCTFFAPFTSESGSIGLFRAAGIKKKKTFAIAYFIQFIIK